MSRNRPKLKPLNFSAVEAEIKPIKLQSKNGDSEITDGVFHTITPREILVEVGKDGIRNQRSKHYHTNLEVSKFAKALSARDEKEKYLTITELGRGQCPVHLAISLSTFRLVAIKIIRCQDSEGVTNASNEIKVLHANKLPLCHRGKRPIPNSVKFFDARLGNSYLELVFEYMDGGSLADIVAKSGAMKDAQLRWVTFRITECLESLRKRLILHRDIKPGNVLVSKGNVYLSDFSTAIFVPEYFKREKDIRGTGTVQFMCPKRLHSHEGLPADALCYASDVWSLGMTIYCLAVGQPVPHAESCAITIYQKLEARGFDSELEKLRGRPELYDFLRKCLDPDPSTRHTARQLLTHKFLHNVKPVSVGHTSNKKTLKKVVTALKRHYLKTISDARMDAHKARVAAPTSESTFGNGIVGTSVKLQKRSSKVQLPALAPSIINRTHNVLGASMGDRLAPVDASTQAILNRDIPRIHTAPILGSTSKSELRKVIPTAAVDLLAHQLDIPSRLVCKKFAEQMPWIPIRPT